LRELILKGGPHDGWVVDLDHTCSRNDVHCPVHGYNHRHGHTHAIDVQQSDSDYDMDTGEYLGLSRRIDMPCGKGKKRKLPGRGRRRR